MYYLHLVYGRNGVSSTKERLYGVILRGVKRRVIENTFRVDGPFETIARAMVRASAQGALVIGDNDANA